MWQELIATGFYLGRFRYAPGTFGTLLGVPLVYLFAVKWWLVLFVAFLLYLLGVWVSGYVVEMRKEKDPEDVVIDEVLGYLLSYTFVEPTFKTLFVGFLTFRLLDILKPYPIKLFENLPKGHGVMADDAVAGIINAFVLFFLFH
jgi:phosphatidylglycerophosphatase A